jgi:hypothetical protein
MTNAIAVPNAPSAARARIERRPGAWSGGVAAATGRTSRQPAPTEMKLVVSAGTSL